MARICRNGRRKMMKKLPIEEDTSNLPCDVIENILSRLPVKSLFRFKSVSKPWYAIISDSRFAKIHLHQSKNSDSVNLFLFRPTFKSQTFSLLKFTNQNHQIEALEFPLKKYRQANVLGYCDGLVLLKNNRESDKMIVLWNPSSRAYIKFPFPYKICNFKSSGLCYDASNDDYKVILLVTHSSYVVFSCKNNSWIERNDSSLVGINRTPTPGLYVDGALHWVVIHWFTIERYADFDFDARAAHQLEQCKKRCRPCFNTHYVNYPTYKFSYNYTHEILYFDPRDDKFKKLPKPESLDITSIFHLTDLRGKLCLYRNTYDLTMMEIWMMKVHGDINSWTKLLTIENVPVAHKIRLVKPLCFTIENNIILDFNGSGLVVYNPKNKKFGEACVYSDDETNFFQHEYQFLTPFKCLDSLFLPSKINRTKRMQSGHQEAKELMTA